MQLLLKPHIPPPPSSYSDLLPVSFLSLFPSFWPFFLSGDSSLDRRRLFPWCVGAVRSWNITSVIIDHVFLGYNLTWLCWNRSAELHVLWSTLKVACLMLTSSWTGIKLKYIILPYLMHRAYQINTLLSSWELDSKLMLGSGGRNYYWES